MPESDKLDLAIRSALDTYADPGPESGLEGRVLARVSAEAGAAPRRRGLPWALALPVAAALLLLLILAGSKPAHRLSGAAGPVSPIKLPLTANAQPGPPTTLRKAPVQRSRTSHEGAPEGLEAAVAVQAAPLPKLDVFPTPQPLTPEEQALTVFAARAPQTQRQALLEAQKQADAPLTILAIHIQPLEPPGQGGN